MLCTLDANVTMLPHVKALSSSCFHHIRFFRQIRSSLDDSMAASIASALISSRLDQLNFILYGTLLTHTSGLRRIQHAVARVVLHQHSHTSHTSPLSSNNSIGFLLNGVYGLNLPRPSKVCTLTSCNIMNLRGLFVHPVLISF